MAPDQIGIDSDTYTINDNGTSVTCSSFFNDEIKNKYATAASELLTLLDKRTTGDLSSSAYIDSLTSVGVKVNSDWIADNIGKFNAYIMNAAALAPLGNAFRNFSLDITSGQDIAKNK